jgi:hypothetical protein|tara:strand:+ start:2453 stop:2623 length:171 start_codon:yes stop_codon:yes gene_type:complete
MNNKKYNKADEIAKIKEAKKNGEIYISPLIFGDNALVLQSILNNINLNDKGGKDVK